MNNCNIPKVGIINNIYYDKPRIYLYKAGFVDYDVCKSACFYYVTHEKEKITKITFDPSQYEYNDTTNMDIVLKYKCKRPTSFYDAYNGDCSCYDCKKAKGYDDYNTYISEEDFSRHINKVLDDILTFFEENALHLSTALMHYLISISQNNETLFKHILLCYFEWMCFGGKFPGHRIEFYYSGYGYIPKQDSLSLSEYVCDHSWKKRRHAIILMNINEY